MDNRPLLPSTPLVFNGFKYAQKSNTVYEADITVDGPIKHNADVCLTSQRGNVCVTGKIAHKAHVCIFCPTGSVTLKGPKIAHAATVFIYAAGDVNIFSKLKHSVNVHIRTNGRIILHGKLKHSATINWCSPFDLCATDMHSSSCSGGIKHIERAWDDPVFVDPHFPYIHSQQAQLAWQQQQPQQMQPQQPLSPMEVPPAAYKTIPLSTAPPVYTAVVAVN